MYARMYSPLLPLYVAYCWSHTWPIYMRMYAHLNGIKISIIRKAVTKRQALYLIWTSL